MRPIRLGVLNILFGVIPLTYSLAETVTIEGGRYVPLYGAKDGSEVSVQSFSIDEAPVTNSEFLAFVRQNPEWRKSNVKQLFAEDSYLEDWESDLQSPPGRDHSPVTRVSWFAARAYCKSRGMRLPLLDEWEMVAMADAEKRDARADPDFVKSILSGYETSNTYRKKVKQSEPNAYGVYDLHGLVWEWVDDFNSVIISGESRGDGDNSLFCAGGAVGAGDLLNYAAFIRYAFRASLKANFAVKNLGFRCAKGEE